MTRSEAIELLKQMACCVTKPECDDRCPYVNAECVALYLDVDEQYSTRVVSALLNVAELLEAEEADALTPAPAESDPINHPAHYTYGKHECIEEMEILFGREAVISYCRLAAYKYKYRAGHKDDAALDYAKADWYLDKAKMLSARKEQEVHDAHKQQE